MGSLIGWIVLGLVAGFLARMLHPGNDSMGIIATIALGIVGSLLGGFVAYLLKLGTSPFEPGGWILATLGAIVLLVFGWFGTKQRAV
ncbi:MAG: GlsB/YeaQ/YmgE family stress response membrane protein [Phycisphaera sp. RhM]|nr:GlsB/YeaQ/YmgE family stress response membrane protein [Phycisphaera sp. RhM]